MKSIIVSIAVAAGLAFAGSSMSADMPAVAKKNGCVICHSIDKKVVGPAWQAVADKYKGDAGAADKLSTKIAKGGGGVWALCLCLLKQRLVKQISSSWLLSFWV